jgi:hypothetical protein
VSKAKRKAPRALQRMSAAKAAGAIDCVCGHAPELDPGGIVAADGEPIGTALYCLLCTLHLHAGGRTVKIAVRAWSAVVSAFKVSV